MSEYKKNTNKIKDIDKIKINIASPEDIHS